MLGNLALALIRQGDLDEAAGRLHEAIDVIELNRGGGGLNIVFSGGRNTCEHRRLSVSGQVGIISGPGRPMVPLPPRSPTAFVITRGRCPGPYTRLPATDVTGRFRVSRQNARRPARLLRRGAALRLRARPVRRQPAGRPGPVPHRRVHPHHRRTPVSGISAPLPPPSARPLAHPRHPHQDRYTTEAALRSELGLDARGLRTAIVILYKRRRVDRIGDYTCYPATPDR